MEDYFKRHQRQSKSQQQRKKSQQLRKEQKVRKEQKARRRRKLQRRRRRRRLLQRKRSSRRFLKFSSTILQLQQSTRVLSSGQSLQRSLDPHQSHASGCRLV